jgi:flagellar biosynthesis protein FlhG
MAGHMQLSDIKLGQAVTTARLPGTTPVQVIAVTGGKGGTGKTSVAVNLAQALANAGRHTLLLDADLGMANVDVMLGLEARHTLFDVLYGPCKLEDIILTGTQNLQVIPAASGVSQLANLGRQECAGLVRAFSDLREPLETLVVDTATGISSSVASFCSAASEILVVACNEPAALRDTAAQIQVLFAEYGVRRFRILANMVSCAHEGQQLFQSILGQFTNNLDFTLSYAGYIPADDQLRRAVALHQPVVNAFPRSRAAMALTALANRVSQWPQPQCAGGHLEFFVERLIHNENMEMEVVS